MKILGAFQRSVTLNAFEFFSEVALSEVTAHSGVQRPFESKTDFYVLIECECETTAEEDNILAIFEQCMESGWALDGTMSQSRAQASALWRCREDISETIAQYTPYKNDISVTVSKVPEFLMRVERLIKSEYPDFRIVWFGHIGDGNVHLNILKPDDLSIESFVSKCETVSPKVFEIVRTFGGSISAEHGVGLLKKKYLNYSRSPSDVTMMQGIKQTFDPHGILNPGKIFESVSKDA